MRHCTVSPFTSEVQGEIWEGETSEPCSMRSSPLSRFPVEEFRRRHLCGASGLPVSQLSPAGLPPQGLRRQNLECRAQVPRRSLGWVWTPSLCPFSAPTSDPDTQSLCLSSTVSTPCGPQVCFCQLKPCQEGLVGVLPAAGASPPRGLSPANPFR